MKWSLFYKISNYADDFKKYYLSLGNKISPSWTVCKTSNWNKFTVSHFVFQDFSFWILGLSNNFSVCFFAKNDLWIIDPIP